MALESLGGGSIGMILAKVLSHGEISSYVVTHGKACRVNDWGVNTSNLLSPVGFSRLGAEEV